MTHSEMVKTLVKPGNVILKQLTPDDCHLLHMAIGLVGESLEIIEAIQNNNMPNLLEELGDAIFYDTALFQIYGIEFDNKMDNNRYMPIKLTIVCGEILDLVKKKIIYREEINENNIIDKLFSVRSLLSGICSFNNFTIEQAQKHNLNKLIKGSNARYKEGTYSDKQAQERADKK